MIIIQTGRHPAVLTGFSEHTNTSTPRLATELCRIGAIDALGLKLFWLRPLRPQLRSSRLKSLIFRTCGSARKTRFAAKWHAGADRDRSHAHVTVIDVPAFLGQASG